MTKKINNLQRVDERIEKEYKDISNYRDEHKLNKITFRRFTELICRHSNFIKIKEDIAIKEDEY